MYLRFITKEEPNDLHTLDLRGWGVFGRGLYGRKYRMDLQSKYKGTLRLSKVIGDGSSLGSYRPIVI